LVAGDRRHIGRARGQMTGGEYIHKHDWKSREESKHPSEQTSWVRAVAFFAGEAPQAEGECVYRLRRKATTEYQRRGEIHAL